MKIKIVNISVKSPTMQPCAALNRTAYACAFAKNTNQALTSSQSEAAWLCVLRYLCI